MRSVTAQVIPFWLLYFAVLLYLLMCRKFSLTLKEYNTNLISYSENFDTNIPIGRLIRNILGCIAEFQLEEYSENIKMALNEKAKRGGRMCHMVLGYDPLGKDEFTINEKEKKELLKIFSTYEETENTLETSNRINKLGYRGKRGIEFTPQAISQILKRALYCGYIEHDNKIYTSDIPRIISVKRYNILQIKLFRNGKKKMNSKRFIIENDNKINLTIDNIEMYSKKYEKSIQDIPNQ